MIIFLLPLLLFSAPLDDFVMTVKTDNVGVSASNEFTVPVTRTNGNGYNVDCNDSGIDDAIGITGNSSYTCVYASPGTYTIRVKDNNGDKKGFRRIRFYVNSTTTTDSEKLLEINQWGTAIWSSMSQAYRGAANLTVTPTDIPDLSGVSNFRQMFQGCSNADINTAGWDISTISNISAMFRGATVANPDVRDWNTSAVTNMAQVFYNADNAAPDVSIWTTDNVTLMHAMFRGATMANPDIAIWNTSGVTRMDNMFRDAANANPDVVNWDVSSVINMSGMFQNAILFDRDLGNWDVSSVENMSSMFRNAILFNQNLGDWNVSNVTKFANFLKGATLSTHNYDALLKGWAKLTLSIDERFDAGNSTYCSGESARDSIIANYNWDIRDGGKNCAPCEGTGRQLQTLHWTLVSFSCDTGNNSISSLLGDALGVYGDSGDWVMYEQTGADNYIGTPNTEKRMLDASDTVSPAKGYWIISASDANMTLDHTLSGLSFTAVQPASGLGIANPVFDDVNLTELPGSDANSAKKVMIGNPFPSKMQLSDVYFSHGGGSGTYNPMDTNAASPNAPYINATVYTYDHSGTNQNNYIAIAPDTPGFTDTLDPMLGFWIKLESGQTGKNYMTFPLEK